MSIASLRRDHTYALAFDSAVEISKPSVACGMTYLTHLMFMIYIDCLLRRS